MTKFSLLQCGWGCEALCDLQDVHRVWLCWALQPLLISEGVGPPLPPHIPDPTQPAAECNPGLARSQPAARLRHTSMPPRWHFPKASLSLHRACNQYRHQLLLSPSEKKRSKNNKAQIWILKNTKLVTCYNEKNKETNKKTKTTTVKSLKYLEMLCHCSFKVV